MKRFSSHRINQTMTFMMCWASQIEHHNTVHTIKFLRILLHRSPTQPHQYQCHRLRNRHHRHLAQIVRIAFDLIKTTMEITSKNHQRTPPITSTTNSMWIARKPATMNHCYRAEVMQELRLAQSVQTVGMANLMKNLLEIATMKMKRWLEIMNVKILSRALLSRNGYMITYIWWVKEKKNQRKRNLDENQNKINEIVGFKSIMILETFPFSRYSAKNCSCTF